MRITRVSFQDTWSHMALYHGVLLGLNSFWVCVAALWNFVPVAEWSLLCLVLNTIVIEKYFIEYEPAVLVTTTKHIRYIIFRSVVSMYLLSFVVSLAMWRFPSAT